MQSVLSKSSRLLLMIFVLLLFNNCAKQFNSSYNNIQLAIDSIVPANGTAGTPVRIYGKGFALQSTDNTIFFNGLKAVANSGNSIGVLLVNAPSNGSTGNVSVKNNNDSVIGPVFTYTIFAPHIQSISPASGTPLITVVITGSNFSTTPSKDIVLFNNVNATIISADANRLQVKVPASSTLGNVPVTVSVNGIVSNSVQFQYLPYAPVITAINPNTGTTGTQVTITGSNFIADTSKDAIYFNGVKATIVSATTTQLIVLAPNSTTGKITVTSNGLTANGPVFTYFAPVILNIVYNGLFGITGQYFDPTVSVVSIGGQVVSGFTYSNNGNGQESLVKQTYTPPASLDNPATVTVSVNNVSSNVYSFLFYPRINSISPDTVSYKDNVTIQGILFGNQTVASTVKAYYYDQGQNKIYMSPSPAIVSWNTNNIHVTMPDYGTYPIGSGASPFYLEVDVSSKSGVAPVYFHIL